MSRLREIAQGFTRTFWVANGLELVERFAFYGAKAAGTLAGLFSGVLYCLPILAGPVVDRYGFKKSLAACFSIFCVGYFLLGPGLWCCGESIVLPLNFT